MFNDEFFGSGTTPILPRYEVVPNLVVANEEVVGTQLDSSSSSTSAPTSVTSNYCIASSNSSRPSTKVNVTVSREVSVLPSKDSNLSVDWVPKRVILKMGWKELETVAWAHTQQKSTHISSDPHLNNSTTTAIGEKLLASSHATTSMSKVAEPTTDQRASEVGCSNDYSSKDSVIVHHLSSSSSINATSESLPSTSTAPSGAMISNVINCTQQTRVNRTTRGPQSKATVVKVKTYTVPVELNPKHSRRKSKEENKNKATSTEHITLEKFACPEQDCSAVLSSRTALRKHATVHAPRNFQCEDCGRQFAERTKLNRHYKTHSGERPFKCNVEGCDRSFALEANLKSHNKTHTGEKPHKCPHCSHAFSHPYNLKVHLLRRHKVNTGHNKC